MMDSLLIHLKGAGIGLLMWVLGISTVRTTIIKPIGIRDRRKVKKLRADQNERVVVTRTLAEEAARRTGASLNRVRVAVADDVVEHPSSTGFDFRVSDVDIDDRNRAQG
jgi:hypothetical protein